MEELIGASHIQHKIPHKDFIQMHIAEIALLESLASKADKFEKKALLWGKFKMGLTASSSWTFFTLGCIITIFFDDPKKLLTTEAIFLYVFLFFGLMGIVICWSMCRLEQNLKIDVYDSPIQEIIDILQKLQKLKNTIE